MNGGSPFSPRAVLALVLGGALLFVAMLWMLGTGAGSDDTNDGGAHVGGKGLTGYAALAGLLDSEATEVRRTRTRAALRAPGLLVLTPPSNTDPDELDKLIEQRRSIGPTLVIAGKWQAVTVKPDQQHPKAKTGWVELRGIRTPDWVNKVKALGEPAIQFDEHGAGASRDWSGLGFFGLRAPDQPVQYFGSDAWQALVRNGAGNMLAGYLDDGDYPELADAAGVESSDYSDEENRFPVVLVAEPDLLNNYGLADRSRARLAVKLVHAAMNGESLPVNFDLTLPGHGIGQNLLTLAFTPPFVAATLCLLLAALAVGWRGFARFGPPRLGSRAIAFGKTALVGNAAGLLRRARRLHLLGPPYAEAARERLARALALPARFDPAMTEAAIDRALAARDPAARPFSVTAAALRAAHRQRELLSAARDLHSLERTLTR